jgi:predicted transcriptional regulator
MTSKVMSLRLPWDLADAVAAVARTDEMAVSEAIRQAIANHIASRQADLDFQERLRKRLEEDREVLERLAK